MKLENSLIKKSLLLFLLSTSTVVFAQAQTEEATPPPAPAAEEATPPPSNEPIKGTFENGVLINNQTVEGPSRNSIDFIIQHRFGVVESHEDLFGLFAPSNIRLGVNYGITKSLSVGAGVTKNKKLYDFQWKYILLRQTSPGGMPVTVTYFGTLSNSALPDANFNNQENKYLAADRLSYFNQIMIARKFNSHLSLQVAFTQAHVNIVDTLMRHDVFGVSFAGRYKFSPQSSVLLEYDHPLTVHEINKQTPNIGIGYEVSTGSHQFQVFVCTADAINNAQILMYNQNDFTQKQLLIGFNITRQWGF